ncbi:MAG: outer membrane lipoprotein-sorting protein [Terriglobia bacterium]
MKIALIEKAKVFSGIVLAALLLATPGCLVRKVTHVHTPGQTIPAHDASLAELVAKIDAWSDAIHTLTATVDLEPTAGSVYSGVIKEYHDVKGFVLLQRPSTIRLLGQAPVVRTNIFDMVSNGEEFRLYIPIKGKFIIGKTAFQHPAKNALENLRPQHILQALIVPPIDPNTEYTSRVKVDHRAEGKRFYVVSIVAPTGDRHVILRRTMWFDRADLELARVQFWEPDGTCTEDVLYSKYQDFQGIHYPTHIELSRPEDDYEVTITIEKATFNQSIAPEKFDLQIPEGAELIDLSAAKPEEHPSDK